MKALVFDTGPVVSLTMNHLLWLLEPLKKKFGGKFYLTEGVRKELIDKPIKTKKFKLEALQTQELIDKGVLEILKKDGIKRKSEELLDLANNILFARRHPVRVVHTGEIETIAAAQQMGINNVVIDERITRSLLENPEDLRKVMEKRLHTKVSINKKNLGEFRQKTRHVRIIRSVELAAVAFELGLLDRLLVKVKQPRKQLLESVLWGLKLDGCSVSVNEINEIMKLELKK